MLVVLEDDDRSLSRDAARMVAYAVNTRSHVTLGLATGGTPMGMYRELVRLRREEGLDFSHVVTFNLDEYLGLPPQHPQSYHAYMARHFFDHVNVRPENIHMPEGTLRDSYGEYCAWYEGCIREAGGIDLQIVGIGKEGHLGFNEAGSSLNSRTRLKTLATQTRKDNRRFFGPHEEVPECAITMGLGTILEARKILLLASGEHKAHAVAAAVEGPVTASVTASVLQFHPQVTVLVDQEAAARLRHIDDYRRTMDMTRKITPQRLWGLES
ncbi:glucosamine-6-phosphate deaminase [Nitrospira sp. Nam74]